MKLSEAEPSDRIQIPNSPSITNVHAKYLAHELLLRHASDSVEKLAAVLADAQVDLNPHQVEAALFAFRSPFSRGAILADEVGLGKTIEAGLLIAQRWAERKRHLLVIVPANLRKQWSQELADKFYLHSEILEARSFNATIKAGNLNPFDQPTVIICSYQFARAKDAYVRQTPWDLVVVDEAHRLRNVYKASSKIAATIKAAVDPYAKVLLTATPLQNSLLELYGLVSFIDEHLFGDLKSYRAQFARVDREDRFTALKQRLQPICKRTLRRQVLEYVSYTNRYALVQEFMPSAAEQQLYDLVSDYLQRPALFALPARQRHLMTLILRKLLASSSRAIAGTLEGLQTKLAEAERLANAVDAPPDELPKEWELMDELEDEWEGEESESTSPPEPLSANELPKLREEMSDLARFVAIAKGIDKESKGEVLLTALRRGLAVAREAQEREGAANLQDKAVIFTESRRTQLYLQELLERTEFTGKIVLFNGSNNDPVSRQILAAWLERHAGTDLISSSPSANMRAALIDRFKSEASILIATEAAAEGVNLQFCNLVVNYDLPWNPQRIEQRIGRCHRYGQKFDVVVVNFLNKTNAADQRVYQLLSEKFKLFDGVFGASDEVLGTIGSGVDFEKRIAEIYQRCRTPQQIEFEFDQLQDELGTQIAEGQRTARELLLDNFDQEVVEKVRIESIDVLGRFNERLWALTRHELGDDAVFDNDVFSFHLRRNPFGGEHINAGPYVLGKARDDANTYRVGHPLAQRVLERAAARAIEPQRIRFDYTGSGRNIAILKPLIGQSGWLACDRLNIESIDVEDTLLWAAVLADGSALDADQARRLFDLVGTSTGPVKLASTVQRHLDQVVGAARSLFLETVMVKNGRWFDAEVDKLDKWAEDRRVALKAELDELDQDLKDKRRAARTAPNLPVKLALQRDIRTLEDRRTAAWREFDAASRDIEAQKDGLLDEISKRLNRQVHQERLFTIEWELT